MAEELLADDWAAIWLLGFGTAYCLQQSAFCVTQLV